MLLSGELAAGSRINDSQLAKRFGISRGPVRDAITRLAEAGLVDAIAYRGAFVRAIDVEDALEIYEIRAALERAGTYSASRSLTPETLAALKRQVASMEESEKAGDREGYFQANLTFHRLIHEASGNRRLLKLYEHCSRELRLFRHFSLIVAGIAESNEEHHRIIDALERGDGEAAATEMELHVLSAKERLVKLVQHIKHQTPST